MLRLNTKIRFKTCCGFIPLDVGVILIGFTFTAVASYISLFNSMEYTDVIHAWDAYGYIFIIFFGIGLMMSYRLFVKRPSAIIVYIAALLVWWVIDLCFLVLIYKVFVFELLAYALYYVVVESLSSFFILFSLLVLYSYYLELKEGIPGDGGFMDDEEQQQNNEVIRVQEESV